MLKYLHSLETIDDYNQAASLIDESFADFGDEVKIMSEDNKKTTKERLIIVNNILNFALNEQQDMD